jgi:uncharacterized protein (DUF2252 family)
MKALVRRLIQYHQGRDPERLLMKYQTMAESPCAFYRGTPFLFYESLAKAGPGAVLAPKVWLAGDAHLENFGVYKGANRLVYFDSNDFDEAALGPCWWDLLRLLGSLFLRGNPVQDAVALLDTYTQEIARGKAMWMERGVAVGPVRELMRGLKGQSRKDLLDKRTVLTKKGKRSLLLDGRYALPVEESLLPALEQFCDKLGPGKFFRLRSAGRRIAGNSSLGVERYVLLIEGEGSPDGNYLLDLKSARPSEVAAYHKSAQPEWSNEAERICWVQQHMQAVSPAYLEPVLFEERAFVLRELMPREDRVRLNRLDGKPAQFQQLLLDEARVLAWGHLRSVGRKGAASGDDLQGFCASTAWRQVAIDWAQDYAAQTKAQWEAFRPLDFPAMAAGKDGAAPAAKSVPPEQ